MARLTAEGEAVDYSRRLTVAQEQLAEYAAQKEEDAARYLHQAQSLEAMLATLLQSSEDSPARSQLQAASHSLCQKLAEEAGEAKSFAAQQKADVERAKRSSSQVHAVAESAAKIPAPVLLPQAFGNAVLLISSKVFAISFPGDFLVVASNV